MNRESRRQSRIKLGAVLMGAGVVGLMILPTQSESMAAQQSNFMGGNPSMLPSDDMSMLRLRFPAGSRSNWHTHTDGQLLMVEEGRGRTQVRGEPVLEMLPGEPWYTAAAVEHWHGAAPDEAVVQLTIYSGSVTWMAPVSDEEYRVPPRR